MKLWDVTVAQARFGSAAFLVITSPVLDSTAVWRLCRPFLSDRFFFLTVWLLERRSELRDADFHPLALAFRRERGRTRAPLWIDDRQGEYAFGSENASEKRRTADLKNGGPRYLLERRLRQHQPSSRLAGLPTL